MSLISTILGDSPTAFYECQETSGTTANDSSGNGYNATINGTVTLGASGPTSDTGYKSFALDGSTGYIALPAGVSFGGDTAFTVELLFSQTATGSNGKRIVANSHTDSDHKGFQIYLNESSQSGGLFDFGNGTTEYSNFWSGAWTLNTWNHLVCIMKADGHGYVYLNNTLENTSTFPANTTVQNNTFPINIGRNPAYNGDYWKGSVCMVAFYAGVALTPTQVSNHYNAFQTLTGAATFAGHGRMIVSAQAIGKATLLGQGRVTASAQALAHATLSGQGRLIAAAQAQAQAIMAGHGRLAATAQAIGKATLAGHGALIAAAQAQGGATLSGHGALTGSDRVYALSPSVTVQGPGSTAITVSGPSSAATNVQG